MVKEWTDHADIDTTIEYLHFAPRARNADLVAEAFSSALREPRAPPNDEISTAGR